MKGSWNWKSLNVMYFLRSCKLKNNEKSQSVFFSVSSISQNLVLNKNSSILVFLYCPCVFSASCEWCMEDSKSTWCNRLDIRTEICSSECRIS